MHKSNISTRTKQRKLLVVKPSKYEASKAIHENKTYWENVFYNIEQTAYDPDEEYDSRRLSEVLPSDIYEKVCNTLDIPITPREAEEDAGLTERIPRQRTVKETKISKRKFIHVDREANSDTEVELSPRDEEELENVHWELLKKPEREQITWATHYLQPERDDEKTLVRKADDLTDKIAKEFCEYMRQLGGDQQSNLFTPEAIKDLFQIEFDVHVARSLRLVPKEIPTIDESIAIVTSSPEKSQFAKLEREIARDIKAEKLPTKTNAFGKCLPRDEQHFALRNNTKETWKSAQHVPRDLVSLKTVWEGITNLRSVKEYCKWMIDHPEHRRAQYLKSLGMFDPAVLQTRLTFEMQRGIVTPPLVPNDETAAPIEHLRKRLSLLAESND